MRDQEAHETPETRALRVARELGAEPTSILWLHGVMNTVLRVVGDGIDWVIRSPAEPAPVTAHDDAAHIDTARHDAAHIDTTHLDAAHDATPHDATHDDVEHISPDEFLLEQWSIDAARACDVPVPEVVYVGVSRGVPVMVSRYVQPAPEPTTRPWWWLGRYASALAAASLDGAPTHLFSRFGRDLEHAWAEHLAYNQASLAAGDPLCTDGAYRPGDLTTLRQWLHDLEGLDTAHGLVHGDLAPRNIVSQGRDAAPVLLDWGAATTGPVPWTELQRVFHTVVVDQDLPWSALVDHAEGMGTDLSEDTLQTLRRLSALRLLDLARWARDRRPDLYPSYRNACSTGLAILQAQEHEGEDKLTHR